MDVVDRFRCVRDLRQMRHVRLNRLGRDVRAGEITESRDQMLSIMCWWVFCVECLYFVGSTYTSHYGPTVRNVTLDRLGPPRLPAPAIFRLSTSPAPPVESFHNAAKHAVFFMRPSEVCLRRANVSA